MRAARQCDRLPIFDDCKRAENAEALNVYRRCREVLSIVLGAAPPKETQAVLDSPNANSNGSGASRAGSDRRSAPTRRRRDATRVCKRSTHPSAVVADATCPPLFVGLLFVQRQPTLCPRYACWKVPPFHGARQQPTVAEVSFAGHGLAHHWL